PDVGVFTAEGPDERGHDVFARDAGAADRQLAADSPLELLDGLPGLAGQRQQAARVTEQERARPGRRGAAAEPIQQLHAELVLEAAHVLGDRRLGQEERLGGAREAAQLGDLHEDLEPTQVHDEPTKREGPRRALRDGKVSRSERGDQWQPHPPPPQQPPPPDMLEATAPALTPTPNTESLRVTSPLAHAGHATLVDAP